MKSSPPDAELNVTMLIPSYNNEDTIGETLRSVLHQGEALHRLGQVVLADDGSVDKTRDIARSAWRSDVPLDFHSTPRNRGQWPNVNEAFDQLVREFDWVITLHADDVAEPGWLAATLARIEGCGIRVGTICSGMKILEQGGRLRSGEPERREKIELTPGSEESLRRALIEGGWWHISGSAIRSKAFIDVGRFRDELDVADWEWMLRLLERGWGIEFISDLLIVHRHREVSVAAASFRENRDLHEHLLVVDEWSDHLTGREMRRLYVQDASFATRRVFRAILSRSPSKVLRSLGSLGTALFAYVKSFGHKQS